MKRLFFLLLNAVSVLALGAQSTQIASLCHGGEIKMFYSGNGLKEAYAEAADGDIITLSAGTFASTNLTGKKVTIRGAGMEDGPNRTVVTGSFDIKILPTGENASFPMNIEGIYFNGDVRLGSIFDLSVIKCGFKNLRYLDAGSSLRNCTFLHCELKHCLISYNDAVLSFRNCYLGDTMMNGNIPTMYNLDNCTIEMSSGLSLGYFANCLIISSRYYGLDIEYGKGDAAGCVYVGPKDNVFKGSSSDSNRVFPAETEFFKEGGKYYELRDDIAAEWLGNDGTQVGMHGGPTPFDPKTTNPQITRFDVSSKTTPDGKLAVDIEVKTY